jgi:hypothetical protein
MPYCQVILSQKKLVCYTVFVENLTKTEKRLFRKLSTPQKIQDYLDRLPMNHEYKGETLMSPRRVIREQKAHCIEAALFAAAVVAYHGGKPLLLDLKTIGLPHDYDHVVALFKVGKYWGAISKTNHVVLRYRDPVYRSLRELAMSYFHEYFIANGKKTLRSYSKPFLLSKKYEWITTEENLWEIETALDKSPHVEMVSKFQISRLRKAGRFERTIAGKEEWVSRN